MPSKDPKLTADAIRIRDNQRRSRTRRKEYVESLQIRIQEYERRGVQATVEMQQAAQAVALENTRLRSLLARYGVPQEEIDGHIQPATPINQSGNPRNQSNDANFVLRDLTGENARTPNEHTTSQAQWGPMDSSQIHESYDSTQPRPEMHPAENLVPVSESGRSAIFPEIVNSTAETCCDTAATIIAQLRGDGDTNFARATLGCENMTDCSVKNTTLFQIMDDT